MEDPKPQFIHLVSALRDRHPNLAYLHVVEPRISGGRDQPFNDSESNDFLRAIWKPRPYISAGGYTRDTALLAAEKDGDLVAFGRFYISNVSLSRVNRMQFTILIYY